MTISLTGVSVDTGAPAQSPRALVTPVISTAGNDAQSIARQQLASAVPAPQLLGAYSASIAQQPKPPAKPTTSLPSSGLAAQFIAQGDAVTSEELAIFEPPPPPPAAQETPADDYLNDLRIARGDLASAKQAKPTQASQQAQDVERAEIAKPQAAQASETTARQAIAEFASAVPNLFGQLLRRQTIAQVKGIGAYQLASARNAATKRVPEPVS